MILFPAIDIIGGEVVRLSQGRADSKIRYNADPVSQARAFEADGARFLHVVDLDAAFRKGHNRAVIECIAGATDVRVQVGGGLASLDAVAALFDVGVWRVVIGSAAVENPKLVGQAVERFGERIVVGLDAKDGALRIKGWTEGTAVSASEAARQMGELGVRTLVYTDIARDGMLGAPDVDGAVALGSSSGCRVVVSGGVSRLEDLRAMAAHAGREHLEGVIVGKALYEARLTVPDALTALSGA